MESGKRFLYWMCLIQVYQHDRVCHDRVVLAANIWLIRQSVIYVHITCNVGHGFLSSGALKWCMTN